MATLGTVAPLVPQPAIARAPRSFEEVIAESGLEDWSVTWLKEKKGDLNGWCHRFFGVLFVCFVEVAGRGCEFLIGMAERYGKFTQNSGTKFLGEANGTKGKEHFCG